MFSAISGVKQRGSGLRHMKCLSTIYLDQHQLAFNQPNIFNVTMNFDHIIGFAPIFSIWIQFLRSSSFGFDFGFQKINESRFGFRMTQIQSKPSLWTHLRLRSTRLISHQSISPALDSIYYTTKNQSGINLLLYSPSSL